MNDLNDTSNLATRSLSRSKKNDPLRLGFGDNTSKPNFVFVFVMFTLTILVINVLDMSRT